MNEETALWQVKNELAQARRQHAPMRSAHEGWAVIKEKVDGLWEIVRRKHETRGDDLRKEAVQVAAMGLRFLVDLCEPGLVAAEKCQSCGGPHSPIHSCNAAPIENPLAEFERLVALKMAKLDSTRARAMELVLRDNSELKGLIASSFSTPTKEPAP